MLVSLYLAKAKLNIVQRASWTKNAHARDKDTKPVHPASPDATCFCADGACEKVKWGLEEQVGVIRANIISGEAYKLLKLVAVQKGFSSIMELNDKLDWPDVIRAFDAAIQLAKEKEKEDGQSS